jgi:hypothetical protein
MKIGIVYSKLLERPFSLKNRTSKVLLRRNWYLPRIHSPLAFLKRRRFIVGCSSIPHISNLIDSG